MIEALGSHELVQPVPNLLIVLGKNIGVDSTVADIRNNRWNLSVESRINATAAGELYRPGMHILFSGGKTAGEDFPPEAAAMYNYFKIFFPDIPKQAILFEDQSIDTASNAAAVAEMLKDTDYKHIGLLSIGYHTGNAVTLFKRYGVTVETNFASEEVIKGRSTHHDAYVVAWGGLKRVKTERKKETVRKVLLNTVDRKGKLLQKVTKRSRK